MVLSSTWKGLRLFHERVWTNTTDPARFLDSSVRTPLDIVSRMWWRALGVAAVLLCVGVAGGYAVADRSEEEPATSAVLVPVPAESPAMPTPSESPTEPDPDEDTLSPDLSTIPAVLRLARQGAGVVAQ